MSYCARYAIQSTNPTEAPVSDGLGLTQKSDQLLLVHLSVLIGNVSPHHQTFKKTPNDWQHMVARPLLRAGWKNTTTVSLKNIVKPTVVAQARIRRCFIDFLNRIVNQNQDFLIILRRMFSPRVRQSHQNVR